MTTTGAEPTRTLVIFGGTGDLAARLLLPALARLEEMERLDGLRIVVCGLEDWSTADLGDRLSRSAGDIDAAVTARLRRRCIYVRSDLSSQSLRSLKSTLSELNIHYLALPPTLFAEAAEAIAQSGIAARGDHRLVVEKPFGTDEASASALEAELHQHWAENQIFRIDHFLGKETVQNLSIVRFANRFLEPLLNASHIEQVQITVAESLGVEGRYRYYDGIGALRDMIQNHLMQLFCLAAMEPPALWDPEILRDHKVEVLRSVKTPTGPIDEWAARGQYSEGSIDGKPVGGYLAEPGIAPGSSTETFAAVRLEVDNWRWQGVPFYLRSGKRLGGDVSEIAYQFKGPPNQLFEEAAGVGPTNNWLVFRLNRPEGIDLFLETRVPGLSLSTRQDHLHVDYSSGETATTAYEQLLLDVMEGDHTPFLRSDEIDWSWRILDPVLAAWRQGRPEPYEAGGDGPPGQDRILLRGHQWKPLTVDAIAPGAS